MESWREVWRTGFAKVLPTEGLVALAEALRTDDPRLVQGSTTYPTPLMSAQDEPVEAGCALGFIGAVVSGGLCCMAAEWAPVPPKTNPGAATVRVADEFFSRACFEADQLLGEVAACRWFLNWFDNTPRDEMRRELLAEVELVLAARQAGMAVPT